MGRRNVLELFGAGALGLGSVGTAAADGEDDEGEERSVTKYQGDGSISNPGELGEAITTPGLWAAVTDVDFVGEYGHAEVFSDDESLVGYPTNGPTFGVISNGVAKHAPGSPSTYASTGFYESGSADLPNPTSWPAYDAAYLSMTFDVPDDADELSFSYRFATEEIPTWVGSRYQDYFAFEVEYPDGSSENVATLPGGEPVTVDNAASYTSTPNDVVYNAITPTVTNTVDVSDYRGETLTVNIGVADVSDSGLDSAVFLDAVGFGDVSIGEPAIESVTLPPTAVETDDRGRFEVVVETNGYPVDDLSAEAPITLKRRGDPIGSATASTSITDNGDGTATVTGSLPRAGNVAAQPAGVEFETEITIEAGGDPIDDSITTSTFAFLTVDEVYGVAAKPNDVTPSIANTNLRTLLRDQSEYVNRFYASGLGSMGAKGFAFTWLNIEGAEALADDGYLELDHGFSHYDDGGGLGPNSQKFVKESLDTAATAAGVDYDDYDTAIATNGPYQGRRRHILSRSFWRGTPLPRIRIPVINETIDLGEPTGMRPFDTDGGLIDGIYAPLNVDTWLHEFGHSLGPGLQIGFPDLYEIDTPFQNFGNVMDWGLMGGRDGKVLGSFNRTLGEDPFVEGDGWLNDHVEWHIIDDLTTDLPDLTTLELGDDATYVVSIWGYFDVDIGLKVPEVEVDWQFGIFLLEGRPGGDAQFSAPWGYVPPLSPDPFDTDGVALFEFGLLDLDVDVDGVKEIIDDIRNDRSPDLITLEDAEAIDINYVPPAPNREDRPTLHPSNDSHYHAGAATTFELTEPLDSDDASVTLVRDTGTLGDAISFIVDVLGDLEDYVDAQLSGTDDPLPPLDVYAETPDGRRAGFDPETGEVLDEIDGASVGGTVSRRRVTVPASVDAEFHVSSQRLEGELRERGIEPPEEFSYERRLVADEDRPVEDRDGLPFLAGRTAVSQEATSTESALAVRTVDVEIEPRRINADSEGNFVTTHLGFDQDVDVTGFEPAPFVMSGVQAVHDDQYGFVTNPPTETRDGRTYVTVKFPRGPLVNALGAGDAAPQVIGHLDDALVRGRGSVTVFESSASSSSGNGGGSDSSGTGDKSKGGGGKS